MLQLNDQFKVAKQVKTDLGKIVAFDRFGNNLLVAGELGVG